MKEGWKTVKLGEVCKIKGGSTPIKSNKLYWENGTIPWFTVDDIREQGRIIKYTNKSITELAAQKLCVYPVDTILLCCTASIGEYAITKIETTSNQQFNGLMIKDKSILSPEYLFHLVSTLKDVLLKLSGKTTIDFVSVSKVSDIEIPLPPLEEQHRIVSILDASFEKIDALKKNAEENLKNAKAFYDKLLIEKFSHKEGWIKSTLQDECFKITDGTHQTPKYFESGHIFLSSGNVTNRKIDWDNIKFIDEQQHQEMQKRVSPKINDILLAKNGTTGVAALVDRDVDFDIYVSLALLRTLGRITPQYMYYFVNSPIAKSQFNKRLKGAGVPNLHLTEIRQVEISYPKDIEKQNEIVKTIENIDEKCRRLEQVAQQTIRECDALKQSILRQAFSGEL